MNNNTTDRIIQMKLQPIKKVLIIIDPLLPPSNTFPSNENSFQFTLQLFMYFAYFTIQSISIF